MMQYYRTFHKYLKIQTQCNQAIIYSKELDYKKRVVLKEYNSKRQNTVEELLQFNIEVHTKGKYRI